jgi:hypothetical protein
MKPEHRKTQIAYMNFQKLGLQHNTSLLALLNIVGDFRIHTQSRKSTVSNFTNVLIDRTPLMIFHIETRRVIN